MRKYIKNPDLGNFDFEPAMTFTEIALELGVSQSCVQELFNRGMSKLINKYRGVSHEKAQ